MTIPSCISVMEASSRIRPYIHRTPVYTCQSVNKMLEADVFFKCENFQKVGAFKARGAMNAMLCLEDSIERVVTHSSGNHGAAIAWAAGICNKKAFIVVPKDASPFKRSAILRYGGEIIDCESNLDSRESTLKQFLETEEATFIPPFDDPNIIAGQGTAVWELIGRIPALDQVWLPIGGGGLAAGAVIAVDGQMDIVCAEPELANDAYTSMRTGVRQDALPPRTIADGLRASIGQLNFNILYGAGVEVVLATEQKILEAMKIVWEHMKIVIEPSAAVTLAAMLENRDKLKNRIGVVLSGGNVALSQP